MCCSFSRYLNIWPGKSQTTNQNFTTKRVSTFHWIFKQNVESEMNIQSQVINDNLYNMRSITNKPAIILKEYARLLSGAKSSHPRGPRGSNDYTMYSEGVTYVTLHSVIKFIVFWFWTRIKMDATPKMMMMSDDDDDGGWEGNE